MQVLLSENVFDLFWGNSRRQTWIVPSEQWEEILEIRSQRWDGHVNL